MSRAVFLGVPLLMLCFLPERAARAAEPLPMPRPAQPVYEGPIAVPPAYLRRDRYEVWQYYGVDSHGHFQPLVVESPIGPIYRGTGVPAPWVTVNPRSYQRTYIGQ